MALLHRAWELMTMGSIVVLEKNVGFDRPVSTLYPVITELISHIPLDVETPRSIHRRFRCTDTGTLKGCIH